MGIEDVVEDAVPAVKGIKWALYGGVAAVVLVIAGLGYYFYKQYVASQATIAVQKEQVHEVKQDLKVADTGAKANDVAQTVVTQQKDTLASEAVVIRNTLQKRETKIKQTVKDPVQQTTQLSQARMQSVWDTYCQVEPTNATCQQSAAAAQGASAASEAQVEGPSK